MDSSHQTTVCIGWTTVPSEKIAKELADRILKESIAACIQIDGPITSMYPWGDTIETSNEFRLTIKFPKTYDKSVETIVLQYHPYEIPQWITVTADQVTAQYHSWLLENTNSGKK